MMTIRVKSRLRTTHLALVATGFAVDKQSVVVATWVAVVAS